MDIGNFFVAYDTIPAKTVNDELLYVWDSHLTNFVLSDGSTSILPNRFYLQFFSTATKKNVKYSQTQWAKMENAKPSSKANAPRRLAEAVADGWQPIFLDPRQPQSITARMLDYYDVAYLVDIRGEVLDEEEWAAVREGVCQALDALVSFRRQEGAALERKFKEKVDNIERLLADIEPWEKQRVEKIRARIVDGLKQIPEAEYDKNRLEQELIYYIEKLDISEEKQRLANHLRYFRETMAEPAGGQGKKLGFIAQEMGREINTTGSKSNQAEMQNIVVKMKDELEQIKEQVLNAL
jgi:uncharacterized protein YicC (UPF0701 family)